MVILHIASIENDPYSGVAAAVPQMIGSQAEYTDAQIGFVNVRGIGIESLNKAESSNTEKKHTESSEADNSQSVVYKKGLQLEFNPKTGIQGLFKPFDRPDLVVFHEVYYPPFLRLAKECRKNGWPYIIVPHGCLTDRAQHIKRLKKLAGNILLFNSFIKGAAALQCLSESEAENSRFGILKFIGTNGVRMPEEIKNAADNSDKYNPAEETGAEDTERGNVCGNTENTRLSFIFIGRIDMYIKGLDILVEAVYSEAEFLRENKCVFELYGPDCSDSVTKLRSMINERKIQDLICIRGPVSGIEKEKKLLESDIFIQSSRSEGMPTGILEAMSHGLPCVLSKGTGLAEIVRRYDAGWTDASTGSDGKNSTSPECLAAVIKQAVQECAYYDRTAYRKKSDNVRLLAAENFSLEAVAKNTVEKYSEIIEKTS